MHVFLQSIIDSVGSLRAGSQYTPTAHTREEARNTLKFGFADKVTAPRAADTPATALQMSHEQAPLSAGTTALAREQLFWYNRTMNDLFTRFPRLRNLPAIPTLKLSAPLQNKHTLAKYWYYSRELMLSSLPMQEASKKMLMSCNSGYLTPKQDLAGLLHHEYAHHLSRRVVPEQNWIPTLGEALKAAGIPQARINTASAPPAFDQATAEKVAKSVSKYAAIDARECAAEILSWYMNPEYGKSVERMPEHLEHWVTECFPMLTTD